MHMHTRAATGRTRRWPRTRRAAVMIAVGGIVLGTTVGAGAAPTVLEELEAADAAASTFRPPGSSADLRAKFNRVTTELIAAPEPSVALASEPPPAQPPPTPTEVAIATARAQLGKPYRWAAMGPDAFDCSGFTLFVWAAAGVHLPHSSRAQFGSLPGVPFAEMRPGDLVYSPGHIGMYIGDGRMIHSPHSGENVQISPLHSNLIGAVRPG